MNLYFKHIIIGILSLLATARASQLTVVTSSKAIIYADRQLSTPIGYLPSGKNVRVGEGLQRGGKILPILITGKIAYIKVEDLDLREKYQGISNGKHIVEHNTDSAFTTPQDKLSENIFLLSTLTTLAAYQAISFEGSGSRTTSEGEEEEENEDGTLYLREYTIYLEHRQPYGRYTWGVGLGFLQSITTGESLNTVVLRGVFKASIFKTHYFTIEGVIEPFFSGDVNLGTAVSPDPDTENEKLVAALFGYRTALQATFFPLSKYGAVIGLGREKAYISQLGSTPDLKNYDLELTSNLIYFGMSYKF